MKVALDRGCREIDAPSGRRYRAKDGILNTTTADGKAVVKLGGLACSLAGTTKRVLGYRCTDCGFGSFFRICSRCGGQGTKELKAVNLAFKDAGYNISIEVTKTDDDEDEGKRKIPMGFSLPVKKDK